MSRYDHVPALVPAVRDFLADCDSGAVAVPGCVVVAAAVPHRRHCGGRRPGTAVGGPHPAGEIAETASIDNKLIQA